MIWAYSDKIKPIILASESLEAFREQCEGHNAHMANYARMDCAYETVKRFPLFSEMVMCHRSDITSLSQFVTNWGTTVMKGGKSTPAPYPIFVWSESDAFFRNHAFLEQLHIKCIPEFTEWLKKHCDGGLRVIPRTFNGNTNLVAVYGMQKYGNDWLLTYLDTSTEFFDCNQRDKINSNEENKPAG